MMDCYSDSEDYCEQPRKRVRRQQMSFEEEQCQDQQLYMLSEQSQNVLECIHYQNIQHVQEIMYDDEWVEAIVIMQNNSRFFATFDNHVYNEDLEHVGEYNPFEKSIFFYK